MKRQALHHNECRPVDEEGLMRVKMYHAEPQEAIQKREWEEWFIRRTSKKPYHHICNHKEGKATFQGISLKKYI